MNVLHIISSLNVGGAERFVIDLAVEQNRVKGIKSSILSMGKRGEPLENEVEKLNIQLFLNIDIIQIRKILLEFDIVHVQSSHCLLRVLLASLFLPIKVVYTRHNERVHQSLKWRLVYFIAKFKLHKMIFVADKARQNYLSKYPSFEKKSYTILNGVLPMSLKKSQDAYFRLSHVGRFVPLKSQHYLIEAVNILPKEIQDKIAVSFLEQGSF